MLSLSNAEQALIVRVAEAYFDVLAARDALNSAREQQRSIQSQLDRAEAAFEAGLDPNAQQVEKLARRGELEKELAAAMEALAVT